MGEKGFTLTELLAVIIILSLLALLASTSVTNIIKNSKKDLYNSQMELIKSAAETWGTENIDRLPEVGSCIYLKVGDLKDYGLLEEDILNPLTNQEISNEIKIKISSKITNYGAEIIEYSIGEDIRECGYPYICKAVSESSKTTGSEPKGQYMPGDEYVCEVKQNTYYRFFLLSSNNSHNEVITEESSDKVVTSINLIAEQNITIDGTLTDDDQANDEWYAGTQENRYGPRTAYAYLSTATSTWTNIPEIESFSLTDKYFQYTTELDLNTDDYITIITPSEGFGEPVIYKNMRARLAYYDEIKLNTDCKDLDSISDNGSCPKWLVNYLDTSTYYPLGEEGQERDNNNLGFWLLDSRSIMSTTAKHIYFNGSISGVITTAPNVGIRPVITVPVKSISR